VHLASAAEPISIRTLADLVVASVNSSAKVTILPGDAASVDNFNTRVDTAKQVLRWSATIGVHEGIAKFARSYPFGAEQCPVLRPNGPVQVSVPAPMPTHAATTTTTTTPAPTTTSSPLLQD
jgi:hypothetical protein